MVKLTVQLRLNFELESLQIQDIQAIFDCSDLIAAARSMGVSVGKEGSATGSMNIV